MASGTRRSDLSEPPVQSAPASRYDQYIQQQLRKTEASVKTVDVFAALLTMLVGGVAYLLAMVVLDQWIVPGGLGVGGRILAFMLLLVGGGYWFVRGVLPPLVRRVNPAYAAHTIERGSPGMKNSLLNFLLFRGDRRAVAEPVYRAIEQQTAQRLSTAPVEAAVDHSGLFRLGYVLVALVALGSLYKVFSPKDPIRSIQRVIAPWADILPPTRVAILDIEPGDVEAVRGDRLTVTAEIRGLAADEPVTLYYSSEDGRVVDRPITMEVPPAGYRFQAVLPESPAGVHDDLRYRIEAGDAISRTHRVTVIAAPTISVRRVEYEYPQYTGLSRRVSKEGDLSALEGTKVTIYAESNQPIKSATLDFDADGDPDLTMKHEGLQARVSFTLALADDGASPRHRSYALRYVNEDGRATKQPVEHRIEVIPDLDPEVELLAPKQREVEVPLDGMIVIETRAIDPDFQLSAVELRGAVEGREAFAHQLLDEPRTGQFAHKYRFVPAREGLKVGDKVDYRAVARDNKTPEANRAQTDPRRLVIVAPTKQNQDQNPNGQQPPPNQGGQPPKDPRQQPPNQPHQQPQHKQPGENQQDKKQQGEQGEKNQPKQGQGEQQNQGQQGKGQGGGQGQGGGEGQQGQGAQGGEGQQEQQNSGGQGQGDRQQPKQKNGEQQQGGKASQNGQKNAEGGQPGQPQDGQGQQKGQPNGQQKGQPGAQNQAGRGQPSDEPVASDGSDDGTAFRRLLESLGDKQKKNSAQPKPNQGDQQQGEPPQDNQQQGNQQPGNQQQGGKGRPNGRNQNGPGNPSASRQSRPGQEQQSGPNQQGTEKASGERKPSETPGQGETPQGKNGQDNAPMKQLGQGQEGQGKKNQGRQNQGQQNQGGPKGEQAGEPPMNQGPKGNQNGQPQGEQPGQQKGDPTGQKGPQGTAGQGAQAQEGSPEKAKQPQEGEPRPDAKGGDRQNAKGESGAGQKGSDDAGSPQPQEGVDPTGAKKQPDQNAKEPSKNDQPKSPAHGNKESNSDGSQGGDRAGGGQEGGGQKANRRGTGSAGQNTAADQGGGQSQDSGKGDTSNRSGDDAKGNQSTGQPGAKGRGKGMGQGQKQPGGGQRGKKSLENSPAGESTGSRGAGRGGNQPPKESTAKGRGLANGEGGKPGDGLDQLPPPPPRKASGQGDKANLDYARKATDLVLEKLENQLDNGQLDQKTLDDLGWTKDDVRRLVDRWRKMKQAAHAPGPEGEAAREELNEALRSLGLGRDRVSRQGGQNADELRNLRAAPRVAPPAGYAEQFKAYQKGLSRSSR